MAYFTNVIVFYCIYMFFDVEKTYLTDVQSDY